MSLPKPYYDDGQCTIYHGDCLEILPELGQHDLILTDPPYGKVKGDFDNEWTNRPAMLGSCEKWLDVMVPAMKANATLYWFAWPSLAGRIEALIAEKLNPLSHIVWKKPNSLAQKACPESLRAPMPETERIIMAEHYGADNMALGESGYVKKCDELRGFVFEPIRKYLADEWARAGLNKKDGNKATGSQMSSHYFTTSQWTLPTKEKYEMLQEYANKGNKKEFLDKDHEYLQKEYEFLHKEYEFLRKEYDDLKQEYEELRRFFDMKTGDQKTDVWQFDANTVRHDHPTVKPLNLILYMVRLSCRPKGLILDPFMGSGTTLRAAKDLGRKAIGVEISEEYCELAASRLVQGSFDLGV